MNFSQQPREYYIRVTSGSLIDNNAARTFYLGGSKNFSNMTPNRVDAKMFDRHEGSYTLLRLSSALEMPEHNAGLPDIVRLIETLIGCEKPYDPAYLCIELMHKRGETGQLDAPVLSSKLSVTYDDRCLLRSFHDNFKPSKVRS